jgi:hypothetical protein
LHIRKTRTIVNLEESDATLKAKSANPSLKDKSAAEGIELVVFYIGDFELLTELWNLVCGYVVATGRKSCGAEKTAAGGGKGTEKRRFRC